MGSACETAHETVEYLDAQRREGRRAEGAAVSGRSRSKHFVAALPGDRQDDRGARPHQGAGRDRRAAVPGRASPRLSEAPAAAGKPFSQCRGSSAGATGCPRRNSRRRWSRRCSTNLDAAAAEESLHGRHQRRRYAHEPDVRPGVLDRARTIVSRACSTGWARTARSARTRTRSRSSARTRTTTPRAISSTTRRRRARSRFRTCASARSRFARPI